MAQGHVTGLDLNKGMLSVARTLSDEGAPIDWIDGSALDLPFPAGRFDLVLCQLGLQFFPDKGRALWEMHRGLSPSGPVYTLPLSTAEELSHDHPTRRLQLWAASPHDRRRIGAYLHVSLSGVPAPYWCSI
jgi:ubiquinone/menaquinone biosynthesis C-methylase UbiE